MAQADVSNMQVAIDQAKNQINSARANLASAEAELERTRADMQYAEQEFNRYQDLVEKGVATRSQYDQTKSRYDQAKAVFNSQQSRITQLKVQIRDAELGVSRADANLSEAQARVKQGQAQLAQQADQLKKTTRYSPIDGVVSSLPVKVGEYALASFSSTPLLTVADMSQINAEIKVDETDIADVQVGQKAKVKVDALGETEIEGEVIEKGASNVLDRGHYHRDSGQRVDGSASGDSPSRVAEG